MAPAAAPSAPPAPATGHPVLGDPGQFRWRAAMAALAAQMRNAPAVADGGGAATDRSRLEERLVQAIWADGMFRRDALATASGKRVEVLDGGRWNTGRGPDFLDARVRLAGEEVRGDIEIHVDSRDWSRHGHHQDFEYNGVVLHVCLFAGDDRPYEEKQNGGRLERLVLESILEPDLETLQRTLNLDEYPYARPAETGVCHEHLASLGPDALSGLFEDAGRARVEEKVARFAAQRRTASPAQLIYQSILTGQGYKSNKTLYFLLSKRAPFEELLDHGRDAAPGDRRDLYLSALLHVAQLVEARGDLFENADEETREFAARLERLWKPLRPYFSDRLMPPTRRWMAGMRPPGFPGRRLAAASCLIDRLADPDRPLFRVFLDHLRVQPLGDGAREWSAFWRGLAELLLVEGDGHYFQRRFTLGGKPARPQSLLGEPAARSLVFNVMLPMAVLAAREAKDAKLEAAAWRAASRFPALPPNSLTTFMKKRLLGSTGLDAKLFRSELPQQGLFKLFHDCCASNERDCSACTLLAARR